MVDVTNIPLEQDTANDSPQRPSEALSHWLAAQQTLAATANLALVTIDADNDLQKTVANETSICQRFLNDPTKATMCAEFCGKARSRALIAGRPITFRCDAYLYCFAAPLQGAGEANSSVLIGGRAFLSASDYRKFLQHETSAGKRPDPKLFSNIKFTDLEEFERNQQKILTAASEILTQDFSPSPEETATPQTEIKSIAAGQSPPSQPLLTSLSSEQLESFFNGSFEHECREAMQLIGTRFHLASGALLMRNGRRMAACAAGGEEREALIGFHLDTGSALLNRLQIRQREDIAVALTSEELNEIQINVSCKRAEAFPLYIGEELTGMLLVLDTELDKNSQTELARLGQNLILPLELARLRSTVNDQTKSLAQWQDFAHLLATRANAPETYSAIVEKVVASLGAERVSLLIYNEDSKKLICKAASGVSQEVISGPRLGEGIAGVVLERGEPLLVRNLEEQSWVADRVHGNAHSSSFISFPLLSGGKRLGVINLTDREANQSFVASDLDWLKLFAPYAAAALERIDLHEKAQRFQLLAITDPLTGLLNRRYLEERFAQEIERSKRYQFPLSFVMMDIDSFKSFNDTFGHQAGDEVLRETALCIRKSLRNFDVAARYGGEEFIVVLPETDVTSATILAERLRKAVEQHFTSERSRHPVTVSIGVSSLSKALQNRHQVIRAADQALYAAKKRGKNCVVVYNTELVPGLA
ncbi:MAG: diguanylate cyclase [Acidobacteria bacterium]|nr:diguanylate cyclase [Acidobacteriota bacterium]